jgi:hypothetical protein
VITGPGWYVFENGWSYSILYVFEYIDNKDYGGCWRYNTLLSRRGDETSAENGENALIFTQSTLDEYSQPILEHTIGIIERIFTDDITRFVVGEDYKNT